MRINCKKCRSNKIKKNGKRQGKQRFLCKDCNYVWEHGKTENIKNINSDNLFELYVRDDLKYRQMGQYLNLSKRTIQKTLDKTSLKKIIVT